MSTLQTGTLFAGRYRVISCIAAGGMGAVYEVLHVETERRRALKVMLPHVLQSEDLRQRFKQEAKVAAHIDSDYIVEVFDAGLDEATGMPFLVMELLRGEELGKRLKRVGRFAPGDVVAYLHQTALALDKTHRASIVHRDLKPENLFLTERDDGPSRVKVLDFGVAKVVAETASAGATQSIGTPLYMAPEQFNPRARLSGAADVYALGQVAYTLLVGVPYWKEESEGGNVYALATVAMHGPQEPASTRAARRGVALPPPFDTWFARITARDPAARFASAGEAVRALGEALAVPVTGPVSGPFPSAPLPALTAAPVPPSGPAFVTGAAVSASGPTAPPSSRTGLVVAAVVGALLIGGAVAVVAVRAFSPPTPAPSVAAVAPPAAVSAPVMAPAAAPSLPASASAPPPASSVPVQASAVPPQVSTTARPVARPKAAATPVYSRE